MRENGDWKLIEFRTEWNADHAALRHTAELVTKAELDQILAEIALIEEFEQLDEFWRLIESEHPDAPGLVDVANQIDERKRALHANRQPDPFARPRSRYEVRAAPISDALYSSYMSRIRAARTRDVLVAYVRRLAQTYVDDPRWPALRHEAMAQLEELAGEERARHQP